MQNKVSSLIYIAIFTILFTACTPTIQVQAPDKPIEINMNIKIEQEVRVKLDKELDNLFEEDSELFGTTVN